MKLVLAFLKKNIHFMGNFSEGNTVVMNQISFDRCPLGYKGVEVYVREDALNNGLTEDFLKIIKEEK